MRLNALLSIAVACALAALLAERVIAHCKEPLVRVSVITPMEYAEPPDWSWMYWWEANRDPYLEQVRQDNRFQDADEDFVAELREDAVALLSEAMEHDQPLVRAEAAFALGRMQETSAGQKIRQLAESDDAETVRHHALLALGLLEDEELPAFLQELRYPTDGLREAAVITLGLLSEIDDPTRASLRQHVRSSEPSPAYASSWVLQQHAGPDDAAFFIDQVRRLESPWLLSDAILALGRAESEAGNRLLADIVTDAESLQELPAWQHLQRMARQKQWLRRPRELAVPESREDELPDLIPGFRLQLEAEQRRQYLRIHDDLRKYHPSPPPRALGPLGNGQLVLGIEQSYMARLRMSAAIALGELSHPDATVPLLQLLNEREEIYNSLPQRFALISLGKLGEPRGLERILAELDIVDARGNRKSITDTATKRGFAAIAAGLYARPTTDDDGEPADRPGTTAALEMLAARLLDPREDQQVRTACAVALGLTRRTEALRPLQRVGENLSQRTDDLLIGHVLLARGMLADRNILQPAQRFLALDNNRSGLEGVMARRAAATGLGMLGSTEGIPILDEAWDLGYDVSREVVRALGMCNAQNVTEMAMGHYADPENFVEQAYMARLLGEVFEARRPSPLASLSNGSNFAIDNTRLLPFRKHANEFLFTYMIPTFEQRQEIPLDWDL